ncbi:hypothetical protein [Embleya sp. NBC_00896]|uniref:hypothetical protein n=1 Tax=Embleya sp. NBC_00896 TaxID=2975961 RepID=UPI0038650552|nr:hypothetical protein OG928_00585 [Embleya sp. NBC_00896]
MVIRRFAVERDARQTAPAAASTADGTGPKAPAPAPRGRAVSSSLSYEAGSGPGRAVGEVIGMHVWAWLADGERSGGLGGQDREERLSFG